MPSQVLREELVEYSILEAIKIGLALPEFGFTLEGEGQNIELRESFPTPSERTQELKTTTVAFGFNMDDGGKEMELGSSLTEYVHTIEVWTFATEPHLGRRVAHAIKHIVRRNSDIISILDFNQEGNPVIDYLIVNSAQAKHQANNSARPWDQFVWTTSIRVTDVYVP